MCDVLISLLTGVTSTLRTRASLQVEILALRHQLAVLQRNKQRRTSLRAWDRILWIALARLWPDWRNALVLVKPETVISWHRKGSRFCWKWKSRRGRIGRPGVSKQIRDLIRDMSSANVLWGARRLHAELLKLGIEVSQAKVAKHMVRQRKPPSQTWGSCLENHVNRTLRSYVSYYHDSRCHLSLDKDSPMAREVQPPDMGIVVKIPRVGGLHHRYERRAA